MREVNRHFFFQAEDGIRDLTVTGVQTCALPIPDRLRLALVPGIARLAQQAPVQIDVNSRRRLVDSGVVVGDVEAKAVRIGHAVVGETLEELVDSLEMCAPDQQVEIGAGPERGMGVERFGEDGTLERDHGDVPAPKGLEKPPKLAAQGEMAGRAFDEVTPQRL